MRGCAAAPTTLTRSPMEDAHDESANRRVVLGDENTPGHLRTRSTRVRNSCLVRGLVEMAIRAVGRTRLAVLGCRRIAGDDLFDDRGKLGDLMPGGELRGRLDER